ncbi:hypothetical protein L1887_28780 [Cichorium endivia]|nr:hypothetical protein L1887_28780 [Cichorium endivia]
MGEGSSTSPISEAPKISLKLDESIVKLAKEVKLAREMYEESYNDKLIEAIITAHLGIHPQLEPISNFLARFALGAPNQGLCSEE